VIGGSSAINAMGHQRGNPAIFDEWAETNPGWSYREMLPLFIKSEDFSGGAGPYHGVGGPLGVLSSPLDERNPVATSFVETAVAMGFPANPDIDGAQTSGAFFNHLAIKDHRRQSTGVAYLHPVMGRPNLTVLTDAALIKLDIVKGRCVGITYDHAGQPRQVRATREVILSTGAVDTPKFLMLAGIGPADTLRRHGIAVVADLPGVGQNLHDHPIIVAAAYEAKRPVPLSHFSHGESMLLSGSTDGDAGAAPDRLLICTTFPASPGVESSTYAFVAAAMNPKSRGTITLGSTDPRAAAVIDPNFLAAGADIDCLASGIALARQVGAGADLADWRLREVSPAPEADPAALRAMIAANAATFNHAVGTCRMGPDSRAVVDHELRVHGVRALRVVDASVIPRIPNAMPNAAIIGIAEKAASLIGRAA
jgi:choline dehydrogenase